MARAAAVLDDHGFVHCFLRPARDRREIDPTALHLQVIVARLRRKQRQIRLRLNEAVAAALEHGG
jgi:hypothetical protein